MNITRLHEAKTYDAKLHHRMAALRLQGLEASAVAGFSCSLSYFLPNGGAEWSASPNEKVYVVLEGEVTLITDEGEYRLQPLDSCFIDVNEHRAIENRSPQVATMLVIVSTPTEAQPAP